MSRRINVYVFDYTFMYICYTKRSSYHLLSYETLWSVSKITITYMRTVMFGLQTINSLYMYAFEIEYNWEIYWFFQRENIYIEFC